MRYGESKNSARVSSAGEQRGATAFSTRGRICVALTVGILAVAGIGAAQAHAAPAESAPEAVDAPFEGSGSSVLEGDQRIGTEAGTSVAPLAVTPPAWEMPDGVTRVAQTLFRVDDAGEVIGTGPVSPGRTFFYAFALHNASDAPVTVTGFASNFTVVMDPARQGDLPDDHCMQFFETRDFATRMDYPRVIAPGETVQFADDATYHYVRGPVSNECQNARFFFGPPQFHTAPVLEEAVPAAPIWRDETCAAGAGGTVSAAVTIPEAIGARYLLDGVEALPGVHEIAAPAKVEVTAVPMEGYAFPAGAATAWSHDFSAAECRTEGPGGDAGAGGGSGTGGTPDPSPPAANRALAATGSDAAVAAWWGAAAGAALLGGALALLGARRRAKVARCTPTS